MTRDVAINDELDQRFRDGTIFAASESDLKRYLTDLGSGNVPNETVRHRQVIRAQVIETVRMFRHLERLDASNRRLSLTVIILTAIAVLTAWFSIQESRRGAEVLVSQLAAQTQFVETQRELIDVQRRTLAELEAQRLEAGSGNGGR